MSIECYHYKVKTKHANNENKFDYSVLIKSEKWSMKTNSCNNRKHVADQLTAHVHVTYIFLYMNETLGRPDNAARAPVIAPSRCQQKQLQHTALQPSH